MPSLWRHNCICRTPHLISMKIFEGHLGIKWSTEKKIHDIIDHVIPQPYCFEKIKTFKNHLLWNGWTDRGETLHVWLPATGNKRFTHMMSLVTWFGSHIWFTLKPIKIHHSKEVLARVCNLWLLFFLFPFYYFFYFFIFYLFLIYDKVCIYTQQRFV